MQVSGGIEFWINDNGRVRVLTVAEADKTKAQKLLEQRYPTVEFATWHPLPSGVIKLLKLQEGEILEWTSFPVHLQAEDPSGVTDQNCGGHVNNPQAAMDGMNVAGSNMISAPRLLIVEDDRSTALTIAKLAEKAGFATRSAMSLDQAKRCLQAERYDCLTLDLTLGTDTGVEVISAIVQAAPGIPIVIITAAQPWVRNAAVSEGQLLGAEILECVPKPIDYGRLRVTLTGLKENFDLNRDRKINSGDKQEPSERYYV